jgi:mannobiose 2-epimerase
MTMPWRVLSHLAARLSRPALEAQLPALHYETSVDELLAVRATLARILTENILPFWYQRAIDRQDGGYSLNHDHEGRWHGRANKHVITQTRTLWFFSRLARSEYGTAEYLAAARHGYDFLRQGMFDTQFGGFYWEVVPSGSHATDTRKHLLGQAYALFALSEYARASGESAAEILARQLFDLLDDRAYDAEYGGYREDFRRDWSPASAKHRGQTTVARELKLFTTHLHLMEAMTNFEVLARDATVKARLLELIMINSSAVVHKRIGACTDRFERDWSPLRGGDQGLITYGHDVENVWLLIEACNEVGLPNGPLLDLYRTLFEYSLAYGFDREAGGFYESGPFNAPADRRDKVWWVQAEALLSALHMYRLTREKPYFTCFSRTLDWIASRQVDWKFGEWHARISESGEASGDKAGASWKGPYHNGRAMIHCLELLPPPPDAATAPEDRHDEDMRARR